MSSMDEAVAVFIEGMAALTARMTDAADELERVSGRNLYLQHAAQTIRLAVSQMRSGVQDEIERLG